MCSAREAPETAAALRWPDRCPWAFAVARAGRLWPLSGMTAAQAAPASAGLPQVGAGVA